MTLVIMGSEVKDIPIKPKEIAFDKEGRSFKYVDATGKPVKKIQIQGSEYVWKYEDGSDYDGKAFKSLKGKPVKEFSKTTLIDKYDTIAKDEAKYFVNNEHTYMLVNPLFKEKMKELDAEGKVISFKYVIRGFKIYRAVVSYESEFDRVIMRCFRGDLRKTDMTEVTNKKELQSDDSVDELSLDDLEV